MNRAAGILVLTLFIGACSSLAIDIRSIRYRPASDVKTFRIGSAKVYGNALAESIGTDLLTFVGFALENEDVWLARTTNARADIVISAELRLAKISQGLDETHSLVIDVVVTRGTNAAARIMTICRSDIQFVTGSALLGIAEDIASEILDMTRKD